MNTLSHNCPYCDTQRRDSKDHIFPKFLGGTAFIRSCTRCNSTFGHTFESKVLFDLAPIMVMLRFAGLEAPCRAVWKKAKVHEGFEIDVDTDLKAHISQAIVERDTRGVFKRGIFQSAAAARQSLRGLMRATGKKGRIVEQAMTSLSMSQLPITLTIGTELRRLAMKVGVAAVDLLGHRSEILDAKSRSFLADGLEGEAPVVIDISTYEPLEKLRPPLSHNVFVKGNGKTGHCYAVVVFYGLIQLYAVLNEKDFRGPDFAVFGFLSPVDRKTDFRNIELISLPRPPKYVPRDRAIGGIKRWQSSFQGQVKAVFGEDRLSLTIEYEGSRSKTP